MLEEQPISQDGLTLANSVEGYSIARSASLLLVQVILFLVLTVLGYGATD